MMNIRKYLFTALCLMAVSSVCGQSGERSYVRVRTMTSPYMGSMTEKTDYTDGMGRRTMEVQKGITPSGKDLVTYTQYDRYGREWRKWLPVPVEGNEGGYVSPGTFTTLSYEFYGDGYACTERIYEPSPMERTVGDIRPGEEWYESPSTVHYSTNGPAGTCHRYLAADTYLHDCGEYGPGMLQAEVHTDEDGIRKTIFKDGKGRTVMERREDGGTPIDTRYVYDHYGNLRFVLQPEADYVLDTEDGETGTEAEEELGRYAFRYGYDDRNRCTSYRMPGCGTVYIRYDRNSRPVLWQDANMRAQGKWRFAVYDRVGRKVMEGMTDSGQQDVETADVRAVRTAGTGSGFLGSGYTLEGITLEETGTGLLEVDYYDDYLFLEALGMAGQLGYTPESGCTPRYEGTGAGRGHLTGKRLYCEGSAEVRTGAVYYDQEGKVVQERYTNLLGGTDTHSYLYSFTGKKLVHRHTHTASGKETHTEVYSYVYDHAERVTEVRHRLDSMEEVVMAQYTYDELGRTATEKLHGTAEERTYSYNIQGWPTAINGDGFAQEIHYESGPGTPRYNGDISSMTWKAGDGIRRGYRFYYDGADRMREALYGEGNAIAANAGRFTERITAFDRNGNILGLQRFGRTAEGGYGMTDNITFHMTGNRMERADEAAGTKACYGCTGFRDAVQQENEYGYDANGNMTKDLNRDICNIRYNSLNLPVEVEFAGGRSIRYTYGAEGKKLRTVHREGDGEDTTDYCGNVIYENGSARTLLTEKGYVTLQDGRYHYFLKDHLGNNRVVVDEEGTVEEVNHYYPFGGLMTEGEGSTQPYKYNGKELDGRFGLGWYDYGARHYDPATARFTTVDPMAGKEFRVSPYCYCGDNPVVRVDKDGRIWDTVWDIANMVYDVGAAVVEHIRGDHATARSHWKDLGMDALAAAIPCVPAGASKMVKAADKTSDVMKAMRRGRESEKRVLKDIGEVKNTKKVSVKLNDTNEIVKTIPDAINEKSIIEIKDTKEVYATRQIRAEIEYAKENGKEFVLITGENTYIPKKLTDIGNVHVRRRADLGPR